MTVSSNGTLNAAGLSVLADADSSASEFVFQEDCERSARRAKHLRPLGFKKWIELTLGRARRLERPASENAASELQRKSLALLILVQAPEGSRV